MYGHGSHATMAWLAVSIWSWRVSVVVSVSTHARAQDTILLTTKQTPIKEINFGNEDK